MGVFLEYIPEYINISRNRAGLGVFLEYITGNINISRRIELGWEYY